MILFASLLLVSQAAVASGDAARAEGGAFAEMAQYREDVVKRGVVWDERFERGMAAGLDEAIAGAFLPGVPVEIYEIRWRVSGDEFLYSQHALQPQKILSHDESKHRITATLGSQDWIRSGDAWLSFDPEGNQGSFEATPQGAVPPRTPPGRLVHAGLLGYGKVPVLQRDLSDPANEVSVADGTTYFGFPARVLTIRTPDDWEHRTFFDPTHEFVTLQQEHYLKGVLKSQAVVFETRTLAGPDGPLTVPASAVMLRHAKSGGFHLDRNVTTELRLEPAPVAEMRVPAKNAKIYVHPENVTLEADFVDHLEPGNIVSVANTLRERLARMQQPPPAEEKSPVLWLLGAAALGLVGAGAFLYRSRPRPATG